MAMTDKRIKEVAILQIKTRLHEVADRLDDIKQEARELHALQLDFEEELRQLTVELLEQL